MNLLKTLIKLALGKGSIRSYSQYGEDVIVAAMLKGKGKGVYVDVGAYHPTLYSTTYALYRRGWSGVVIDPNKAARPLFRVLRPRDRFIQAAVGVSGSATYYAYEDGAYNSLSEEQVQSVKSTKNINPIDSYIIPITPLREILAQHGIREIDYLNVDVEGMDLAVLETHDWNIRPRVITAEDASFDANNPDGSEVHAFLRDKEYALRGLAGLTLIFQDKRFEARKRLDREPKGNS